MTTHAEDPLRRPSISEILDLAFAVAAAETRRAEGLVSRQDGQILDLTTTCATAVCAVVADQRAVAKKEEVRVRVEECLARIASEAVEMPTVASCEIVSARPSASLSGRWAGLYGDCGAQKTHRTTAR